MSLDGIFQVKTETTADLNVLHEQKSKAAAEEHERNLEGSDVWTMRVVLVFLPNQSARRRHLAPPPHRVCLSAELERRRQQEQTEQTEKFHAAQDALKVTQRAGTRLQGIVGKFVSADGVILLRARRGR